ncbi:flagellar hook assembly protein FlgD [Rhodoblastus sp.]|uniref:flagellar hook assembly protein FlgD n=1 Tax=Rhodoblastus sp. TaxID=1962975 RepID=UPI003F975066
MTVSATTGTTTTNSTATSSSSTNSSTSANDTVNYNEFLQLLVAQLQNQDPTNPADPTTFVSQLASFSSVEQQVNANTKLDSLLTQTAISQAGSIIGKTVTSSDGSTSGQVASVLITSSGPQATLTDGKTISLASGITVS